MGVKDYKIYYEVFMKEFRKNIILLPADYNGVNNQKGILTADCNEKNIKCTIKCSRYYD